MVCRITAGVLFALLAACGGPQAPLLAQSSQEMVVDNGTVLNGISPNGISPNGISPNGVSPNGISPNGVSPNGVSPNGVSPNSASPNGVSPNGVASGVILTGVSRFNGTLFSNAPIWNYDFRGGELTANSAEGLKGGTSLQGAQLVGELSNGSTLPLFIGEVWQGSGSAADLWFYRVFYHSQGYWYPLCGWDPASQLALSAVALTGVWNYGWAVQGGGLKNAIWNSFTFACRGYALAKCAELGFKPWRDGNFCRTTGSSVTCGWVPWEDVHQACTRAMRADYCGNGESYTRNGTLIDIYDREQLAQADTEAWRYEAEWGPNGPVCVWSALRAQRALTCQPPPCSHSVGANGGWVLTELK